MENQKKIYVNRPTLPNLDEFTKYLSEIWESKRLTNMGEFHRRLESELADFLGVKYLSLFANGTLALIAALQVLRISGEVITTPYSFVATTHAIKWNGIKPVFCDIEKETCNINPAKIEALITPKTTAILPVHIYGMPCKTDEIQEIADIYGLKVIYDAAHAFAVKINDTSVLNFGDLSVLSFHATKIFNTFEGGAIISHDEKTKRRIDFLRNFGFANETTVITHGINAKMNEMQAALGLLQLKDVEKNIEKRKKIDALYREKFSEIDGIEFLAIPKNVKPNYGYFPIFIDEKAYGKSRDELYFHLKENNIFARRYFYPLISDFAPYRELESAARENLPVATEMASRVISLPIYADLTLNDAEKIISLIAEFGEN